MHKLMPWTTPREAVVFIALILGLIGTINIFSASFVKAAQELNDPYFYLKRHLISAALGLVVLAIAARVDYRRLKAWAPLGMLIVITMLTAIFVIGMEANGARRWLKLGMVFQPSEFAKIIAILITAAYLGPILDKHKPISLISWPFGATLLMGALVYKQPDMGTAVVIVCLCLVLYVLAGLPKGQRYFLGACMVTAPIYLTFAASYRAERIAAWFNPWAYQQTTGYQTVQSLLAIGSGGLTGTGLGMGASKFYYLPEAHTDFAFAVLCQELGFIVAALVIILLGVFGVNGIRIALRAPDNFGVLLAAGMTSLVVCQAIGNIAMVSGLLPVTGVPLPFISYGGTSLIVNMAAIGFLISVSRQSVDAGEQPKELPRSEKRRLRVVTNNKKA